MINCEFENGKKKSLRHVTVVTIIRNPDGKILITKRAPNIIRGGKYTIPGGFLDRDENTKEGAIREVREEVGIEVYDVTLFRINDSPKRPKEDRQNIDFIFLAKAGKGKITMQQSEVEDFEWIDESSLPSDEEFAFDHRDSILRYFEYLKQPSQLPIIG